MEERKDAGNLIYKRNSGLNELLKLASLLPPPHMIYKQKTWLLASTAAFRGAGAGGRQAKAEDGSQAGT